MLLLDNYFFPVIHVLANPRFDPTVKTDDAKRATEIDVKGSFNVSDDALSCTAILNVAVRPPDDATQIPYDIEVTAVGSFSIPEGVDAESINQRASVFAFSILYTAVREMLLMVTSRGPWEKVMLPVHHFHASDVVDEPHEDQPKKKRASVKSRAKKK